MDSCTAVDDFKKKYLHNTQIYLEVPEGDINLFKFEDLALKRLRLLKLFDIVPTQDCKKYSTEWTDHILHNIQVKYPDTFYALCDIDTELKLSQEKILEIRYIDHVSHYVLRMVYCTDKTLERWFINRETDWLFLKFQKQSNEGKELFLKLNQLDYESVNANDMQNMCHNIVEYSPDEMFYKVYFKQALDLIKLREVQLHNGYAYVPKSLLVYCIIERFKRFLETVCIHTKRNMILLNEQQRFVITQVSKLLNNENSTIRSIGNNLTEETSAIKVTLSDLEKYTNKSFPLCMKFLYDTLKENHHLKYGSRIQLGNFFKTIGLTLEESLELWKTEFTRKITETTFEKKYTYFLKHMYGTVGSKRPYQPATCYNIINVVLSAEETHGCPFKTWDSLHMTRKLQQCRIPSCGIDDIEDVINNMQYEKACAKHFQFIHKQTNPPEINSPFDYFKESLMVLKQAPANDISSDEEDF